MKDNRKLLQPLINREASICTDYCRATPDDVMALYALALEYEKIDELERARYLFATSCSLAISNANYWKGKKELVQGTYDGQRRIDNLLKHRSDVAMINKEDKLKELKERTSNANLTGNPRKDAEIYFKASFEYAEIQEYEKASFAATRAYSALLALRTKNADASVISEIIERTAAELKGAEYDFKNNNCVTALGKLSHCKELIQKYAEEFSSLAVSDSPFYDFPRHIAIDALAMDKALCESIEEQCRAFDKFCKNNHLCKNLDE